METKHCAYGQVRNKTSTWKCKAAHDAVSIARRVAIGASGGNLPHRRSHRILPTSATRGWFEARNQHNVLVAVLRICGEAMRVDPKLNSESD